MTVLPYVVVTLISKIGSFTYQRAAEIARHGAVVLLVLWAASLATVMLLPLSLPSWEAGTFFSASLVEASEGFDFLDLYIPTNPFRALSENIDPAAVVFSILIGIALIPIDRKRGLLDPLDVFSDALGNIAHGVIRLAPWGTLALAAGAAGTASPANRALRPRSVSSTVHGSQYPEANAGLRVDWRIAHQRRQSLSAPPAVLDWAMTAAGNARYGPDTRSPAIVRVCRHRDIALESD